MADFDVLNLVILVLVRGFPCSLGLHLVRRYIPLNTAVDTLIYYPPSTTLHPSLPLHHP